MYICCTLDVPEVEALLASGAVCYAWLSGNQHGVCGCRAPALKVLAMDMIHAPNLVMGLMESAGSRLQHLQLVLAESDVLAAPGQLLEGFWRAVRGCTELAALQLVFMASGQAPDQEVVQEVDNTVATSLLLMPV